MLSIERLAHRFGKLRMDVVAQDDVRGTRVSCVRCVPSDIGLACSMVTFAADADRALGARHADVLQGAPIGASVRDAGVPYTRRANRFVPMQMNFAVQYLLTACHAPVMLTRTVSYTVRGMPYCRIRECYSPWATDAKDISGRVRASEGLPPYTVWRLYEGHRDRYLRLAHGFLQSTRYVGIGSVDRFVAETWATYELLRNDKNTRLFVAAGPETFIGYAAVNVHPALHLNGYECMVRELYVDPSSRRQGVATALMRAVEQFARERNAKRIALATSWEDDGQRGFYERVGFARRCDFVTKGADRP